MLLCGLRPLGSIITALLLLLALSGCNAPAAPPVVKLGLIAPFEGPSRPLGYSILYAVRLRLQMWNRQGGSPRVELVALNDDGDPDLAAV
ncbi:MAG: ABC transporter substrate-binding protein, partial [Caldilineae bacterium]